MPKINLNSFAKEITLKEGKLQSVSIAQAKEVIGLVFGALSLLPFEDVAETIKAYKSKQKSKERLLAYAGIRTGQNRPH